MFKTLICLFPNVTSNNFSIDEEKTIKKLLVITGRYILFNFVFHT